MLVLVPGALCSSGSKSSLKIGITGYLGNPFGSIPSLQYSSIPRGRGMVMALLHSSDPQMLVWFQNPLPISCKYGLCVTVACRSECSIRFLSSWVRIFFCIIRKETNIELIQLEETSTEFNKAVLTYIGSESGPLCPTFGDDVLYLNYHFTKPVLNPLVF